MCADFTVDSSVLGKNRGDEGYDTVWLDILNTHCSLKHFPMIGSDIVSQTAQLAERVHFQRAQGQQVSLAALREEIGEDDLGILIDEGSSISRGERLIDVVLQGPSSSVATSDAQSSASSNLRGSGITGNDAQSDAEQCTSSGASSDEAYPRLKASLPACTIDVSDYFDISKRGASKKTMRIDTGFSPSTKSALLASLESANTHKWADALRMSQAANYDMCYAKVSASLGSSVLVLWSPKGRGHAVIALRVFRCGEYPDITPVILEFPHPIFDHTQIEGTGLFEALRARVLLMSGSHRCAIAPLNKCTGNKGMPIKTNCPGRSVYANSDAAHSVNTMFPLRMSSLHPRTCSLTTLLSACMAQSKKHL